MDESNLKSAIAAVSSGEYDEADVKVIREMLNSLNRKETALKRQMEHSKNEYVRNKNKSQKELDTIKRDIKSVRNILSYI